MKALTHSIFQVASGEVIQLATTIDNAPFLAAYTTPPQGSSWVGIKRAKTSDNRQFTCPSISGEHVIFAVSCGEAIPPGAPYSIATYTLQFTSITNPASPSLTSGIAVPVGLGPINQTYTFIVQ